MKKTIIIAAAIGLALPALAAEPETADTAFVFTDIISIPTTPVKDQNKTGTCWCFSGTSFFEDEILRKTGDTLDLSEMYTVRKCYEGKADRFVRLYGQTNFVQGGSGLDVPYVWKNFGAVPEEVYSGLNYGEDKHVHGELYGALAGLLNTVVAKPNGKISTAWRNGVKGILDAYLGEEPTTFEYKGKTYTPQSFAASLPIDLDDYIPLTSFTHHPFYESFPFEVPDNWLWGSFYNLPLNEFKAVVDNSLEKGYPLVWAADISEGGFKWNQGVALMPKGKEEGDMDGTELARWVKLSDKERKNAKYDFKAPVEEITVDQALRQEMFDNQETTDDHGMEIVGVAKDQKGNRYYKVRNSWDVNNPYDGFFYVSEPYFLAKTVNILVNREAIPAAIQKKLGLKK